ncbi:MAG: DNA repair protein RadA [Algiphilus sp.]
MAREKTRYVCQQCGAQAMQWSGQCGDCGAWNSMEMQTDPGGARAARRTASAARDAARRVQVLSEVSEDLVPRMASGMPEFDRVLGGGFVPGGVVLIGGDPGIGKSTLLLQVLAQMQAATPTLYVTGEESPSQVALRARRLGLPRLDLPVLAETGVEDILAAAAASRPGLMVIDSIQTLHSSALESAAGSVSQLRESAAQLVHYAKRENCCIVIVGHVTKEGAIAGPRVLEHMVDSVLYFEHDVGSRYRVVRAVKNRFGAVNELGVFSMEAAGLREVANPSAIFLSGHSTPVPGSAVTVTRQGSRPLLVEVQALVDRAQSGNPRRVTQGTDGSRLAMLIAVLNRHGGVSLADQDVFANVVGGMRIQETAADLPLLLAAVSSLRGRPLPARTVIFGEVGLAGEIRPVQQGEERLREASKQGFQRAIVPAANRPRRGVQLGMHIDAVERLEQAVAAARDAE